VDALLRRGRCALYVLISAAAAAAVALWRHSPGELESTLLMLAPAAPLAASYIVSCQVAPLLPADFWRHHHFADCRVVSSPQFTPLRAKTLLVVQLRLFA